MPLVRRRFTCPPDERTGVIFMILGKKRIKDLALISKGAIESKYQESSYDLTVGTIVSPDGETDKADFPLRPQGIVKVISQEEFTLPANVMAYVHVKTALCNEGVLALNIGIVDPRWSGPLQSALLNFGKVTHRIHKGDVFGRITFHQTDEPGKPSEAELAELTRRLRVTESEAKNKAQSDVDKFLAADFLDFSNTVKAAAKKATAEYRNTLLWYAPVLALLLAIFTYLLNFANMHRIEGYLNVKDRVGQEETLDKLNSDLARVRDNQADLKEELRRLKAQPPEQSLSLKQNVEPSTKQR
jgi:deoxycytidine triphosphate deaminase